MSRDTTRVYLGTYTRKGSEGIYVADFDASTGELSEPRLAVAAESPSFLALHPSGQFLFAVGEAATFGDSKSGAVSAFHVEPRTGELALVNSVASGGRGPCFIEADPSGKAVLVANYGGGSVASFRVRENGVLEEAATVVQHEGSGPDPKRQTGPRAHSIRVDPTGRYALAADLGIDRVLVYRLNPADATLAAHDPAGAATPPGVGPRHLAWHPRGRWAYVANEMGGSVSQFVWDADAGTLRLAGTVSTLPEAYDGRRSCAEVATHPGGRFVYVSNRGHDSLAVLAVDETTGALTPRGHVPTGGQEPRHFAIDPTGRWLIAAHQNSDSLVVFRIDPDTGTPAETGVRRSLSMPVCVRFA